MKAILFTTATLLAGCATNDVTAFSPYVTKDGVQSFSLVASDKLPAYMEGQNLRQVHETIISSELGKRQYCMRGYDIVSVTKSGYGHLVYEGVCKQ